jgi:hypothetical protein
VLAIILPPLGVLLGVAMGALVEPLKLRFAAGARRRQVREERCAEVVSRARDVRDGLREFVAIFDVKEAQRISVAPGTKDRGGQVMDEARKAGGALRSAAALVELGGPDDLAASARAVRDSASQLLLDGPTRRDAFDIAVAQLDDRIDSFVTEARKHVQ